MSYLKFVVFGVKGEFGDTYEHEFEDDGASINFGGNFRGVARLTSTIRPPIKLLSRTSHACCASSQVRIVTKPKP